jgi:hypothetical protein
MAVIDNRIATRRHRRRKRAGIRLLRVQLKRRPQRNSACAAGTGSIQVEMSCAAGRYAEPSGRRQCDDANSLPCSVVPVAVALSGVKRTWLGRTAMSAYDPKAVIEIGGAEERFPKLYIFSIQNRSGLASPCV